MLKYLVISLFVSTAAFSTQHHQCNRDALVQWGHELAHATDEFQLEVKDLHHYEHLAYYAEEVHLAAHDLIDRAWTVDTCNTLWRKFSEMRHDFYHLRDGYNRAQQKLPRPAFLSVFRKVSDAFSSIQHALEP